MVARSFNVATRRSMRDERLLVDDADHLAGTRRAAAH
jgi:hypothetical protein